MTNKVFLALFLAKNGEKGGKRGQMVFRGFSKFSPNWVMETGKIRLFQKNLNFGLGAKRALEANYIMEKVSLFRPFASLLAQFRPKMTWDPLNMRGMKHFWEP